MTDRLTDEQLREWIAEHERAPWITDEKKHPQNIYGNRLLAILKDLSALRARVEKLEAALKRIAQMDPDSGPINFAEAIDTAYAALWTRERLASKP